MSTFDAIIVDSGINSLVRSALLEKRGRRGCMLEREFVFDGLSHWPTGATENTGPSCTPWSRGRIHPD